MTPSMGMAAPKGMATAPQAGLAAIAQPATAPKGRSSGNMAQVMALARKMSDAQLAEVLQGKSLDVPQYVAMTEAMGRKSLRNAMDGQQAMAQAQQPSVKDKLMMGDQPQMPQGMPMAPQQPVMAAGGGLMYADGGIASLPAPNMESMDMASGGIVAFDEGGKVPLTEEEIQQILARGSIRRKDEDIPENPLKGFGTSQRNRPYADVQKNAMKDAIAVAPKVTTAQAMQQDMENAAPAKVMAVPSGGPTIDQINALNARPRIPVAPVVGAPNEKTGIGATDQFASYMDMVKKNNADYLSKLEGASDKQRAGLASIKGQGQGELLLNLAAAAFGTPNLNQMMAKGLPLVSSGSAAMRKDMRDIEKSASEMDLNLAKAQEAAAKGDMEAALKFKQLADEASYRKESLAVQRMQAGRPDSGIAMLNALRDPANMAIFKDMQAGKKGEIYSIDKAADDFNKIVADKFGDQAKRLKALGITNPYQYQQYVLNQGSGGGGGTDLQAQALAELARRSK